MRRDPHWKRKIKRNSNKEEKIRFADEKSIKLGRWVMSAWSAGQCGMSSCGAPGSRVRCRARSTQSASMELWNFDGRIQQTFSLGFCELEKTIFVIRTLFDEMSLHADIVTHRSSSLYPHSAKILFYFDFSIFPAFDPTAQSLVRVTRDTTTTAALKCDGCKHFVIIPLLEFFVCSRRISLSLIVRSMCSLYFA